MKKLITKLLTVTIILLTVCPNLTAFAAPHEITVENNLDVQKLKELSKTENPQGLHKNVMKTVEKLQGYKDSSITQSLTLFDTIKATPFVPNGATDIEFLKRDETGSVVIGYSLNNIRVTLLLFKDGTMRKEVYNTENGLIVTRTNNGKPTVIKPSKNTPSFERSQEEMDEIFDLLKKGELEKLENMPNTKVVNKNGKTEVLLEPSTSFSIMSTQYVTPDASDSDYEDRYTARWQNTWHGVYSEGLWQAGYTSNPYTTIKVYETKDSFVQRSYDLTRHFPKLTSVATIAGLWTGGAGTTFALAVTWIEYAGIAIDSYEQIMTDMYGYKDRVYEFMGGKEGLVYDQTQWNKYVQTFEVWDMGILDLAWDGIDGTDRYKANWSFDPPSDALFQVSDMEARDDALSMYNQTLMQVGYWSDGYYSLGKKY
jgi:hypothetical protein